MQDTIHNIYAVHKKLEEAKSHSFKQVLKVANDAIQLFNDYEIHHPGGKLTVTEYQLFFLTHLIVLDTVNAKFLWKRIPKSMKG